MQGYNVTAIGCVAVVRTAAGASLPLWSYCSPRMPSHHVLLVGSMVQVGAAGDNAAMEPFFALLQKNVLNRQPRWAARDELRIAIVTWIEHTYHQRRRQPALGRMTPIEYEMIMNPQTATAA